MTRKIATRFALALAFAVLGSSSITMQAQDGPKPPSPNIVTGGDPQPIGQVAVIMSALISIVIASMTS